MAKCVPFIDLFSFQDVPIAWDFPVIINSHELGCVIFLFPAQTLKNGGNVLIPCYPTVSNVDP